MKHTLLVVSMLLGAPAPEGPASLDVSLAKPPACAAGAAPTIGSLSVPAASAWAEFHVTLCDGRAVDLRADVTRAGDTFQVVATNRADASTSNSILGAGQSFDATVNDVRLRFAVRGAGAGAEPLP